MADYRQELLKNAYVPNVVVKLKGKYFSIRQPDSGLMIEPDYLGALSAVNISPTAIDPFRSSSVINNYQFSLLDVNQIVSNLFPGDRTYFARETVEIWIGRCMSASQPTPMDFSEYYKLPITTVQKMNRADQSYKFQSIESKDRLGKHGFQAQTALAVDILFNTTIITVTDPTLLVSTSGYIQIEDEIISYTGVLGNNLTGCIRGEFGSFPAGHEIQSIVFLTVPLQGNPIDLLIQLLVSPGGGGSYDVLIDGAGLDESLVDIDQMQEIRDEFFPTKTFQFQAQNLDSLRDFLDEEILFPLNLRLRTNLNGKLGLATLDRRIFDIDTPIISNDNLVKNPDFVADDDKIVNQVRVSWDWDDGLQKFQKVDLFQDTESIAVWGKSSIAEFSFKGIRASLGGSTTINQFQGFYLRRFSTIRPNLSASVLMSASVSQLGDKVDMITDRVPNEAGELNFAETVEVVKSAINYQTGDVKFDLAFTSFTGVRECYIAPSDTIIGHSGKSVTLAAGRGQFWRKGWFCALYDNTTRDYAVVQNNEIFSVVGDVVTFIDDWSIPLVDNSHRIMFSDYDVVVAQQKKYCFICQNLGNFADGTKPYQILSGG